VGDLAQKRQNDSLLEMLVSIAAFFLGGGNFFPLSFEYIKVQKNTQHSPATEIPNDDMA